MIDVSAEQVVSLTEAAKRLPTRRQGKRPNVATLYRWTAIGCRGLILESCQIGGTRCTSVEALQRFFDALTEATGAPQARQASSRIPSRQRQAAVEKAERRLAAAGI
jgi:hypothetical protein